MERRVATWVLQKAETKVGNLDITSVAQKAVLKAPSMVDSKVSMMAERKVVTKDLK